MRISDWSSDVCSSDLGAKVAASDVGEEGADGRRHRRRRERLAEPLGSGEAASEEAHRSRFHVALAPGDLAGEADSAVRLQGEKIGRASCRERVCQYG